MLSNRVRNRSGDWSWGRSGDRRDNKLIQLIQLIERGCRCQSAAGRVCAPSRIGMEIAEREAHRDETMNEVNKGW